MKAAKIVSTIVSLLLCVFSACELWAQSYTDLHLDAQQVRWTDLSYGAKSFAVNVRTDINLASYSSKEFESLWLSHPKCLPLPTACREVYRIEVNTSIDHIFSPPVELLEQVWFEPVQATALHRTKLRRGKDEIARIYWFTEKGVHRLRKKPGSNKEASLPPGRWTDVRSTFYGFDLPQLGCPQVSEPSLLIYVLSTFFSSKNNNPLSLCVFGKQQVHQVRLGVDEPHTVTVDYAEKRGDNEIRRRGRLEVLRITMEARPAKSDQKDPENFSFLGFHNNISIDLDPESRIPVQVSGTIPLVGKVTLKLREAKLRK